MANDSSMVVIESNDGTQFIWLYSTWIVFFVVVSVPNLLLALAVVRHRALRTSKEYFVIGALCLADALHGMAVAANGLYRLHLIASGVWSHQRSPWSCMVLVHNFFAWFTGPCSAGMLAAISFDRLLAVSAPLKYYKYTVRHGYHMVAPIYSFSILFMLTGLVLGYLNKDNETIGQIPMACFTGPIALAINKYWALIFMYIRPVSGIMSVMLYGLVIMVYVKKGNTQVADVTSTTKSGSRKRSSQERKRQRVLTVNLGWSSLWTMALFVMPILVAYTGDLLRVPRSVLQPIWLLPPLNP